MSASERRHGFDLPIRDKDLTTGRDVRRVVREQFSHEWPAVAQAVRKMIADAIAEERERIAKAEAERLAAIWYRRLWRALTKSAVAGRPSPDTAAREEKR